MEREDRLPQSGERWQGSLETSKSLNEEDSRGSTITLDEGGILFGKQAADCFAKRYAKASDLKVDAGQRRKQDGNNKGEPELRRRMIV